MRRNAMIAILCFGMVSLFADVTYEGARSITGPFLASLGASASAVAFLAGLGELLAFGLRYFSGILADRTRAYWTLTIAGYGVNVIAVPLMGLATSWEMVAALVVMERTGKSIRAPARDVMLSEAAHEVGSGWGFGLHAAMDQLGAFVGPLFVAAVFAGTHAYRPAFFWLAVPALCAMASLLLARAVFRGPAIAESKAEVHEKLSKDFRLYAVASGLLAAGFVDFALAGYHLRNAGAMVPVYYACAMGVDAASALILGRLFDRWGLIVLPCTIVASCAALPFLFWNWSPWVGVALWGLGMGAIDSILRAGVSKFSTLRKRGAAYGTFNGVFGICWFAGSVLIGGLYEASTSAAIGFGCAMQLAAAVLFFRLTSSPELRRSPSPPAAP